MRGLFPGVDSPCQLIFVAFHTDDQMKEREESHVWELPLVIILNAV